MTMDEWRIMARANTAARDAVGREIARQRHAGASDAVLIALDEAMRAIARALPDAPRA